MDYEVEDKDPEPEIKDYPEPEPEVGPEPAPEPGTWQCD